MRFVSPRAAFSRKSSIIILLVFICLPSVLSAQHFAAVPSGWLCSQNPGWASAEVGTAGMPDSSFTNGTFAVGGSGTQMFGAADSFTFVYRALLGDGSIVARVASVQGGSGYVAAGVMIRETLDAGSTNAKIAYWPSYAGIYFDTRTSTGGSTAEPGSVSGTPPYWVKLVRSGSTFTSYASSDGQSWTQVGASQTINMTQSVYMGLAVTSGSNSTSAIATFDNVSTSSDTVMPCIASVSATTGGVGSEIVITGSGFGTTQGTSQVLLSSPVTINLWSETAISITIPEGATSGDLRVYRPQNPGGALDAYSNAVRFNVTNEPLPSGWLDSDVGMVGTMGSGTYANGVFTVGGGGGGFGGGMGDAFHYVYQAMTGDGSIAARVASAPSGATAAVLVRETLAAGSTNANTAAEWFSSNNNTLVFFNARTTTNGSTSSAGAQWTSTTLPYWVKVVRSGITFSGYISADGVNWTLLGGSQTINMAQTVYVGLGVSSGSTTTLATATFDNVFIGSSAAPAPVITGISATTGDVGSQVVISGSGFGASRSNSVVMLNAVPVTVNLWNDTSITITIPAGATTGLLVVSVAPSMNDSNPEWFTVTSQPLPSGWLDSDVGMVGTLGSGTYANGVFTVGGGGGGFGGGMGDAFHYVYQAMTGDGSIAARVASAPSGATAAVLVRETLAAGSTNANTAAEWFSSNNNTLVFFNARTTTNGSTSSAGAQWTSTTLPYWVKVVRSGITFSGYISADGVNWTLLGGSQTINMAQTVYVGLGVSSGSTTTLATVTFDNAAVLAAVQSPSVGSVVPAAANVGTSVTIAGLNFGATQGNGSVSFDGVPAAAITSWEDAGIVATVPANATTGPVRVVANGLQSNQNVTFTVNPLVSSVTPSSGAAMTQVQVGGSGFGPTQGASTVSLNSVVSPVLTWSPTSITALVPVGASSGNVSVTVNGVPISGPSFTVITPSTQATPNILGISTPSGSAGQPVTIQGTGFGATQGAGNVLIGSNLGFVVSWSDQTIQATVSSGSTSGVVQVQQGGSSSNSVPFTVNSGTINSISPNNGLSGTAVTINGSGFGAAQGGGVVWIGTVPGAVTHWDDNLITATVGLGSNSGTVQVLQNGTWSNSFPFTINLPHILNINPTSGSAGSTSITITGSGFGNSQGSGGVSIGGAPGIVTAWSDGTIAASIASTAVSGVVKVLQSGVWSNAITVTIPVTLWEGTAVTLVPNVISMVVGDTRTIEAVSASGQSVTGLTWTSSDTTILTLSTDDPPIITAVAPGTSTVTAGNASADVTIYVGPTLPVGTIVWSNPGDGSGVSSIVPAVPSSTGVADVFSLNADCNLQAIRSDGTVAWSENIGTTTDQNGTSSCNQFLPDFQGGAVVNTGQAIYRLDSVTGTPSTAFGSSTSCFTTPVVSTDGTVFVVSVPGVYPTECNYAYLHPSLGNQYASWWSTPGSGAAIVAINPNTGEQNFSVPLENSSFAGILPWSYIESPSIGTPIIAGDGYFYIPYQYGEYSYNGTEDGLQIITAEHSRLLRVGLAGDSSKIALEDLTSSTVAGASGFFESDSNASMPTLITNADQGALASYAINSSASTETNGGPMTTSNSVSFQLAITSGTTGTSKVKMSGAPGQQNPVRPVLQRQDGNFVGTVSTPVGNSMIAFTSSGSTLFTVANDTPQIATVDGGVIGASRTVYDQNGKASGQLVNLPTYSWKGAYQLGSIEAVSPDFDLGNIADSYTAVPEGNLTGKNSTAVQHHKFGLVFCLVGTCQQYTDVDPITFSYAPASVFDHQNLLTTVSVPPDWQQLVISEAMAAFKRAFAKVQSIDVGLSGQAEHAAYVIGGLPVRNGPNYPCALSTNNWPDHSFVYYLINMEQAQVALGNSSSSGQNLSPSYPPTNDQDIVTFRNLARATGSGIGNIAAHEIGHQLNLPIMDCKISTTGSPDCDNNDTQVYEYYDCKGDPLQVIGGNPVGGGQSLYIVDSPLKWGKTDASSLDSKLSK